MKFLLCALLVGIVAVTGKTHYKETFDGEFPCSRTFFNAFPTHHRDGGRCACSGTGA
jgi:hypothetical protein